MNKINIPKEVFDNIFFKDGGQKKEMHKDLTGQFIHSMPKQAEEMANSEIEDEEYVSTKGKVVKAKGETHEEGGIKVKLDNNDKVLSDHLKIGKVLAKELTKTVGVKINPTDTYSKVLDKYLKKIGHTETTEELEGYIKDLDNQNSNVKDEATLGINTQYLMDEMNEEGKELEKLAPQKQAMFDFLFQEQEKSKPKDVDKKPVFKEGGSMQDLIIKYNISPEKIKMMFQNGGNVYSPLNPNNPLFAGQVYPSTQTNRIGAIPNVDNYGYQKANDTNLSNYGSLNKEQQKLVLEDIRKRFPLLADKFLKEGVPKNSAEFQLEINNHYDKLLKDAEKQLGGKDTEQYKNFEQSVNKERFTIPSDVKNVEGLVTDVDAKFGDYTSTRPNFSLDVLPNDVYQEVKNSGVNTAGELKKMFPDYFNKYVGDKGLESDFWLGDIKENAPQTLPQSNIPQTAPIQEIPLTPEVQAQEQEKRRMGLLTMPERIYQNPQFLAPMKFNPTIYSGERVEISPEQQLMEINRSQQATRNQIEQLPDAQRAATLASLDSNYAMASSKAVADAARYNAQAREKELYENAEVKTKQSLADAQSAAQYQQLMGRELAGFEANLQNQNNMRFQDQFGKFQYVQQMSRNNTLNPDIQFNGSTYEVRNPYEDYQKKADEIAKYKKGGRFNKKRFGSY
jgi:hypothetical protein